MVVWRFLLHLTGTDNVSGRWYGFWSGFAGDVSIFGAVGLYLRHHNCHARRCWRLGRHPVVGTPFVTCRHHHPDVDGVPTHAQIVASRRDAA